MVWASRGRRTYAPCRGRDTHTRAGVSWYLVPHSVSRVQALDAGAPPVLCLPPVAHEFPPFASDTLRTPPPGRLANFSPPSGRLHPPLRRKPALLYDGDSDVSARGWFVWNAPHEVITASADIKVRLPGKRMSGPSQKFSRYLSGRAGDRCDRSVTAPS